jgi:hypothetical protein
VIYKYWVKYDSEGEIEGLYRDKVSGSVECIVKVVPISRDDTKSQEVVDEYDKLITKLIEVYSGARKFDTEIKKLTKSLRRIK